MEQPIMELIESLASSDLHTRVLAQLQLEKSGDPRATLPLLLHEPLILPPVMNGTMRAIVRTGVAALPQLLSALEHEHPGVRARAALALGQVGDQAVLQPLIARMNEPNHVGFETRRALARLSLRIGPEERSGLMALDGHSLWAEVQVQLLSAFLRQEWSAEHYGDKWGWMARPLRNLLQRWLRAHSDAPPPDPFADAPYHPRQLAPYVRWGLVSDSNFKAAKRFTKLAEVGTSSTLILALQGPNPTGAARSVWVLSRRNGTEGDLQEHIALLEQLVEKYRGGSKDERGIAFFLSCSLRQLAARAGHPLPAVALAKPKLGRVGSSSWNVSMSWSGPRKPKAAARPARGKCPVCASSETRLLRSKSHADLTGRQTTTTVFCPECLAYSTEFRDR